MEIDKQILLALQDGIREGVKSKLGGYNSPIDKLANEILAAHDQTFRKLFEESILSAVGDEAFREEIAAAIRHKLANILVARFGGELEKQVNTLKSDPATRARITLAVEEIVKQRSRLTA